MDHDDDEVYRGYLLLPLGGKILSKKSPQQKYCYLYKASKFGIERLEVWDSTDKSKGTPIRIITLENCVKICPTSSTHFKITTKTAPFLYEFGALNEELRNQWLNAFQSVAFPDDASVITSIEEDNDLYCSSGEGVFNVKIHSSSASERCGLDNKTLYTVVLTSSAIQLKKSSDGTLLYTWPYCFIRRYGYKSGKFTFEAGRKCDSGEGTFFLEHSNQQEIFRCLASKMKSMKKLLKEESSSSTLLDCGDNQFQAALSMEARSRSPLPPSPTTSTTLHDIDPNISNKTQMSFVESVDLSKQKTTKPKPVKPPRKFIPSKQTESNTNSFSSAKSTFSDNYEPLDKYDRIEYRSNAWRTMGVDDVNHTENVSSSPEEEDEYMSWGSQKTKNSFVPAKTKSPKIITEKCTVNDDSYDKLNFFGSTSKINLKSGYKQIALSSNLTVTSPSSFNDYDEVQPAMEGIRLADDSHLGYALIRKDTSKEKSGPVNHQFHNNEPYAVISKPKRV